jgi:hypothetical protein
VNESPSPLSVVTVLALSVIGVFMAVPFFMVLDRMTREEKRKKRKTAVPGLSLAEDAKWRDKELQALSREFFFVLGR